MVTTVSWLDFAKYNKFQKNLVRKVSGVALLGQMMEIAASGIHPNGIGEPSMKRRRSAVVYWWCYQLAEAGVENASFALEKRERRNI